MDVSQSFRWCCLLFIFSIQIVISNNLNETQLMEIVRALKTIENNVLGADDFQRHINQAHNLEKKKIDFNSVMLETAYSVSTKLHARMLALHNLKLSIINNDFSTVDEDSEPWSECCKLTSSGAYSPSFSQKVNFNLLCNVNSSTATKEREVVGDTFLRAAKDNLRGFPDLKWQYFGSEGGLLSQYPAVKTSSCQPSYDNRFRPWYVRASSPRPKDVVIALDRSASMKDGGKIEATREAAITVLKTLSPQDRVSVVVFSNDAHSLGEEIPVQISDKNGYDRKSCFNNTMASATPRNIQTLVKEVGSIGTSGETYYTKALKIAFNFLEAAFHDDLTKTRSSTSHLERGEVSRSRDRVILFLSDGEPTDSPLAIFTTISQRNMQLYNSVVLLTYALGRGTLGMALNKMSQQNFDLGEKGAENSSPSPTSGEFFQIYDVEHLRSSMGTYYNFFSKRYHNKSSENKMTPIQNTVWSVPYYDAGGLGMVITAASPIVKNDELIGVVGVDITFHQLFSDIKYFNPSDGADIGYVFLLDHQGRVLLHPLLHHPHDISDEPVLAGIEAYERNGEVLEFMRLLMKRVTDVQDVADHVTWDDVWRKTVVSKQVLRAENNEVHERKLTYSCMRIRYTRMVFCILIEKPTNIQITLSRQLLPPDFVFLYHRFDLLPPSQMCRYRDQSVTFSNSAIQFAPSAHLNSGRFTSIEESLSAVDNYNKDVELERFHHFSPSLLRLEVWNSVLVSWKLEKIWKQFAQATQDSFVIWRYFGSQHGVLRIWPGVKMPKLYEPTQRPWYREARSEMLKLYFNRDKSDTSPVKTPLTISAPYLDANGGGLVITMSKAVVMGDEQPPALLGVLAADIDITGFHRFIESILPQCSTKSYDCLVIDCTGHVIYDKHLMRFDEEALKLAANSNYHIIHKHPQISLILMKKKILTSRTCVDVAQVTYKNGFRIDEAAVNNATLPFIFDHVPHTNMFFIVFNPILEKNARLPTQGCQIHESSTDHCNKQHAIACETPCTDHIEATLHFETCTNKYQWDTWDVDPPPCVLKPKEYDFNRHLRLDNYNSIHQKNLMHAKTLNMCAEEQAKQRVRRHIASSDVDDQYEPPYLSIALFISFITLTLVFAKYFYTPRKSVNTIVKFKDVSKARLSS